MILLAVLVGALLVALALLAGWMVKTARRLDRLHVRRDLAWQGLIAALDRRALVARTVAAALGERGGVLTDLAKSVESARGHRRELLESKLSALLAEPDRPDLPEQLREERADAETRVRFARTFYNEAVRDTLALRTRPLVRALKLAGGAPLPTYFEIAETPLGQAE